MVLRECVHFPVHFQKKQISNLSLIQKWIFKWVKNVKSCILTLNFTFCCQLGSLIISRQINPMTKTKTIQWNIYSWSYTRKLKWKVSWAFCCKKLPPELTKMWKIAILGVFRGPGNQYGIPWFFIILWIPESFSFYLLN